MENNPFSIVLFRPQIAGNTGSIGRTALALNANLILIGPYGFDLSEKAVRRAGLDYWHKVKIKEYPDWQNFMENEKPNKEQLLFFSKKAKKIYYKAHYPQKCFLIFGSETKGLPQDLHQKYQEHFYYMPMLSKEVRSLNLSNSVCAICFEALRQQMPTTQI